MIVTKEFWFCAGHRLVGVPKCKQPHGHNYRVEVSVEGKDLEGGMVINFDEFKSLIKWVDKTLDHSFMIACDDDEMRDALESIQDTKLYVTASPPTCEVIASIIYYAAIDQGLNVYSVTVYETHSCSATYSG